MSEGSVDQVSPSSSGGWVKSVLGWRRARVSGRAWESCFRGWERERLSPSIVLLLPLKLLSLVTVSSD